MLNYDDKYDKHLPARHQHVKIVIVSKLVFSSKHCGAQVQSGMVVNCFPKFTTVISATESTSTLTCIQSLCFQDVLACQHFMYKRAFERHHHEMHRETEGYEEISMKSCYCATNIMSCKSNGWKWKYPKRQTSVSAHSA